MRIQRSFLRHVCAALVGGLLAIAPGQARADVTIIVPYGAGGASDLIARQIAELAAPILGEAVNVVNRPGAGGNLGLTEVLQSPPDGKTIGVLGTGFLFEPFRDNSEVPWSGPEDFSWVGVVMQTPYALYVKGDAPWTSVDELVEYSRTRPGEVRYGVVGVDGPGMLRYLMLRESAGIEWTTVPFTGDSDVLSAVLGGHVETGVGGAPALAGLIASGDIRPLAVTEGSRVPTLPDVPTFTELGYPVLLRTLTAVVGPAGIPEAELARLSDAVQQATASAQYQNFAAESGALSLTAFGDELETYVADQVEAYRVTAPLLAE